MFLVYSFWRFSDDFCWVGSEEAWIELYDPVVEGPSSIMLTRMAWIPSLARWLGERKGSYSALSVSDSCLK